jgi:kynurenine formamidase
MSRRVPPPLPPPLAGEGVEGPASITGGARNRLRLGPVVIESTVVDSLSLAAGGWEGPSAQEGMAWFRSISMIRSHRSPRRLAYLMLAIIGCALLATPAAANDLDTVARILAGKTFVDLTHSFGPDSPVWSGFGQAKMTPAVDPQTGQPYTIAKDGFRSTHYQMVGQYGTHVDPPAHFAEDGITMDRIPLKQMVLPLIVLDDTPYLAKDPNHAFAVDDLRAWEKKNGRVPKDSFVALRTDMYKDWDHAPERFKRSPFPAWSLDTVKFLIEQCGVTAIGHESMDTDTTDKMESETYTL